MPAVRPSRHDEAVLPHVPTLERWDPSRIALLGALALGLVVASSAAVIAVAEHALRRPRQA